MKEGKKCMCPHHSVIPWIVVLFGLMFLLHAFDIVVSSRFVDIGWPILVLVAGLTKLKERKCTCC